MAPVSCPQRDPVLTGMALGAVGAATGVALTPFVAPVMLGVVGFSAAGPVAGMFSLVRPNYRGSI